MNPRYGDEERYRLPDDAERIDRGDIDQDRPVIVSQEAQVTEVTTPQVTADQNNYPLPKGDPIRLSTDASRTFTGFTPPRVGTFVMVNVGSFDLVIANNSGSSSAENRVMCHTGADITLNANESVQMYYDYTSSRWRTVGFS